MIRHNESPRTPAEPMAFTRTDFLFGAASTWLIALTGFFLTYAVVMLPDAEARFCMSMNGGPLRCDMDLYRWQLLTFPLWAVPLSLVCAVVTSPAGWALGHALRTRADLRVHTASFVGLGLGSGGAWLLVLMNCVWTQRELATGISAAIAVAVPLGWTFAVARARHGDRTRSG